MGKGMLIRKATTAAASGERRRLDTHDERVPEEVWTACELALARAPSV